jgi:hypothetical protein
MSTLLFLVQAAVAVVVEILRALAVLAVIRLSQVQQLPWAVLAVRQCRVIQTLMVLQQMQIQATVVAVSVRVTVAVQLAGLHQAVKGTFLLLMSQQHQGQAFLMQSVRVALLEAVALLALVVRVAFKSNTFCKERKWKDYLQLLKTTRWSM